MCVCVCVKGPSPPCHETSHNQREKEYRQDRRHPRYRDADRSHVCILHIYTETGFLFTLTLLLALYLLYYNA